MVTSLRRITDGVLFQAVLTGSLSFSHIHDLAVAHGQAGWKAWLYPLSVDLLTVAAYRKLIAAQRTEGSPVLLAWCSFLLGLAASLAANVAAVWQNPDRIIAVALGVWPAVAFLACTLLSHDTTADVPAAPMEVPVPSTAVSSAEPATPVVPVSLAGEPAPVAAPTISAEAPPAMSTAAAAPPTAGDGLPPELAKVAPSFLTWARRVADEHRQQTGSAIDLPTLRSRLKVNEPLAAAVHRHLTMAGA